MRRRAGCVCTCVCLCSALRVPRGTVSSFHTQSSWANSSHQSRVAVRHVHSPGSRDVMPSNLPSPRAVGPVLRLRQPRPRDYRDRLVLLRSHALQVPIRPQGRSRQGPRVRLSGSRAQAPFGLPVCRSAQAPLWGCYPDRSFCKSPLPSAW